MVLQPFRILVTAFAALFSFTFVAHAETHRIGNGAQRVELRLPDGVAADRIQLAQPQALELPILRREGIVATLTDGASVRFAGYRADVLTLPAPRVIDAEGKSTTRVQWEVDADLLRLRIDDDYLRYPITIDLTKSGPNVAPPSRLRTNAGGGAISGKLTDGYTGAGVRKELVHVYDSAGLWVQSAISSNTGDYLVSGLPAGTYFVAAVPQSYASEAYDNVACSTLPCNPAGSTPVSVLNLNTTTNINFVLRHKAARVTGVVVDQSSGSALSGVAVVFFNPAGSRVASAFADATGRYVAELPGTGTYYARTFNHTYFSYADELYADTRCVKCDITLGTPISATLGQMTSGIDFKLETDAGSITGKVTDQGNGSPLADKLVVIHNAIGDPVTYGITNSAGVYRSFHGLTTEKYFVLTAPPDYRGEVYSNVSCPNGVCNPTSGAPVSVKVGLETPDINFTLVHNKSRILGRVTALGRLLLDHVKVVIFDNRGFEIAKVATDEKGFYAVEVPDGVYYARTFVEDSNRGYLDEVWDDIPCTSCDVTKGRAIEVKSGDVAKSIDFDLSRGGGKIAGQVTDSRTRRGLAYLLVDVYDLKGTMVARATSDEKGSFEVEALADGEYFVAMTPYGYVGQVWPKVNCKGDCNPTEGRPVQVKSGSTSDGIDFALDNNVTRVRGFVVDASSGAGIPAEVAFLDRGGNWAGSARTDSRGEYFATIDTSGIFYARSFNDSGDWIDQVYYGIECKDRCDPLEGKRIEAGPDVEITGIDFRLRSGRGLALSLRSSSDSVSYGEELTLTATLSDRATRGQLRFLAGGELLGTADVFAGTGSLTTSTLGAGIHAVSAEFVSDDGLVDSAPLRLNVKKGQRKVEVTGTGSSIAGQNATFRVRISSAGESARVVFRSGTMVLGTITSDENGFAELTIGDLPAGQHSIAVTVAETTNYAAGLVAIDHEVKKPVSRRRAM